MYTAQLLAYLVKIVFTVVGWPRTEIALKCIDREIYIWEHPCQAFIAYVRQANPDVNEKERAVYHQQSVRRLLALIPLF